MKVLIKHAKIISPNGGTYHGKTTDLLIEDGIIKKVADDISEKFDTEISIPNLHISPGWMDCFAHFCDPGYEYKETLETGAAAAAAGGFTTVFLAPNTLPAIDSRTQVEYILKRSDFLPVHLIPIGAVSKGLAGKELAEMYDMSRAGAIAFSDGLYPIQSSGLQLKALQYVKAFGGTLIQIPEDQSISAYGLMHEGLWSTRLGVTGIPDIAELAFIKRDLDLLRYADSKLHFTGVSLVESVALIKAAKKEGLNVTLSVTPYHLTLTDEALRAFDSNYKVNPPLREQEDVEALRQAVREGWIDGIATHHIPQDQDGKDKEFEYAESGMIGLETAFGLLGKALPDLPVEDKIDQLAIKPRQCFGLEIPKIEEGEKAELTLFDPDKTWTLESGEGHSKSKNSPFYGEQLKGLPLGIINGNKLFIKD